MLAIPVGTDAGTQKQLERKLEQKLCDLSPEPNGSILCLDDVTLAKGGARVTTNTRPADLNIHTLSRVDDCASTLNSMNLTD